MYEVRCWSEQEWLSSKSAWDALLLESSADPLFSSWDWQTLWWQHFGREVADDLRIYAFYQQGQLIGLAPLYLSRQWRKRVLASRSLQLIGNHWRNPDALISEYLGLIAHRAYADDVQRRCVAELAARDDWNELVVACTRDAATWQSALATIDGQGYSREIDSTSSYQADLSGGFEQYLGRIGASTRRAMWGLRRRLVEHRAAFGASTAHELEPALAELNRLHGQRWGSPVFAGPRLAFHLELAGRLAHRGQLQIAQTKDASARTIAVSYDVRIGDHQYNIQTGFDATFDARISLGLLHFGHAMEQAAEAGVRTYDFLAGPGLRSNYKAHLAQRTVTLTSVQFLRGTLLSSLYRWHDRRARESGHSRIS